MNISFIIEQVSSFIEEISDSNFITKMSQAFSTGFGVDDGWTSENIPSIDILTNAIVNIFKANPEIVFPILARDLDFDGFGVPMGFFLEQFQGDFDPFLITFYLYKDQYTIENTKRFFLSLNHFIERSTKNEYFYNVLNSISKCLTVLIHNEDFSYNIFTTIISILDEIFPTKEALEIKAEEISDNTDWITSDDKIQSFQLILGKNQYADDQKANIIENSVELLEAILENCQAPRDIPFCAYEFIGSIMLSEIADIDLKDKIFEISKLWNPQYYVPFSFSEYLFPIIGNRLLHLAYDAEVRGWGSLALDNFYTKIANHLNMYHSISSQDIIQLYNESFHIEDKKI